jgi:hypothetical protein
MSDVYFHDPAERGMQLTGMTLRDYFSAKAMQAYVSSDKWREDMDSIRTASMAYRMADAMLKERDK